ncbi:DUF732 domain-containing protein [Microtetraspora sp. NBRC 16547]|uniref:DUF732 domain-containing protein n=1 Tax=Microtetraspora sp. NBRC 16547 TaxID=3030993 RepID=UPI0024A551F8|nr:DUF732 domain-containing protein [Microtetraspora sp. NBRC 16547]GLW99643.1 hypothetical protein Misp02_37300 [Microtetraspora sp. NBRC 16547]
MQQTPGYQQHPYDHSPQQQRQPQQQQPQPGPTPPTSRRKSRSKAPWLIVAVILVVAVVGVVTFLLTGSEKPESAAKPAKSAAAPRALQTPDAGQRAVYLETLQSIAPGLAANEDRAIRQAGKVCDRILNPPESGPSLAQYTIAELSSGDTTITQAQAFKVIVAVKVWCAKS